jgi:hypothetical protein
VDDNSKISFINISNLYDPATVYECFNNNIKGPTPEIKDQFGNWNTHGHPKRIIEVTENELKLFAKLIDSRDAWEESRLSFLHTNDLISILEVLANHTKTIGSLGNYLYSSRMFNETLQQKKGIIKNKPLIPLLPIDTVLSGPHIGLANPLFKSARKFHKKSDAYDCTDLTVIPEDFRQRVLYSPAGDKQIYLSNIPTLKNGTKYTSEYRICVRNMINNANERCLLPVIIPKGFGHINAILGVIFSPFLSFIPASMSSIVFDFLIKISGITNIFWKTLKYLPLITDERFYKYLTLRALLLNCLTIDYSELWNDEYKEEFNFDSFSKDDSRLSNELFHKLTKKWSWNTPLRTDYSRRQALLEIDVLTAMALGLSLDHLQIIYRFYFALMRKYDNDTYYDSNGRIVFTSAKSLTGIGLTRNEFEEIKDKQTGFFVRTISNDTTLSDTPTNRVIKYYAPFDKCDREKDYETAWKYFSKLLL